MSPEPQFQRYIGIDYSGAEVPSSSLKGLRVYVADGSSSPTEEPRLQPSPKWYWSRRELAEWLAEQLAQDTPSIVGIDHAFSFPLDYFRHNGLALDWLAFLDDFCDHWPTDEENVYVDFVLDGHAGNAHNRWFSPKWKRLTEERSGSAKSVFQFDVPGQVAKSTHAGLPWLRYLRREVGDRLHLWPFDGWTIPAGRSAVVEVYPRLWHHLFPRDDMTADQHDAYVTAAWLQEADRKDRLKSFLAPGLGPGEHELAEIEGWILGVR